jgi:hypothetical protein
MKTRIAILLLAIFGVALSAEFTAASASRMDGKCCRSSDGGRSYRYSLAKSREDRFRMCPAAKPQCMRTGVHVGSYGGRQYAGTQKK